jgi:Protein of unknown function (DUF3500)
VSAPTDVVGRMADAALALLDALSTDQRRQAQWEFPSDEERLRWFYTPTDNGGLTLGENHVHTVWRDPVGDFGMDALGAHRRRERSASGW